MWGHWGAPKRLLTLLPLWEPLFCLLIPWTSQGHLLVTCPEIPPGLRTIPGPPTLTCVAPPAAPMQLLLVHGGDTRNNPETGAGHANSHGVGE